MGVRRIYVEKKPDFAVHAKKRLGEIHNFLNITAVTNLRLLIRYDMENISDATYMMARDIIFSEPPVDVLYEGDFPRQDGDRVFSVEPLPGQFDQRADSAQQCVRLIKEDEEPLIRSALTYVISGNITDTELDAIKDMAVNPVDSRISDESVPKTLAEEFKEPPDVAIFGGFADMGAQELRQLYDSLGLAMSYEDFECIQSYFQKERRDPTVTEIRVLDTYWSDHCRHTTFLTELTDIKVADGPYREKIEGTLKKYLKDREKLYEGRKDKYVCLMDIATLAAKKLKKEGKLDNQEETDEINACSIIVPVKIDGKVQEWLINFKNETHNHPTEIEPFGGAATCLGGAIRDPLSGRTYVYQAMRITGAADPTVPLQKTLEGKLPQRRIVTDAAAGYSSYGNQIGLATGFVKEIYHPGYVAKRMEIGAVVGAAPRENVMRLAPAPGDIVLLVGGRTGRDGEGGATGSSKSHTTESLLQCGAEVQKGNPPTERKLQRLFRRKDAAVLIKKCNDFGAGGVSVAIGELADGLLIDLDRVPKKYEGLDGTEIAISESQERMAIVIAPKDLESMLALAHEENLEATQVAEVTKDPRLVMTWRGKNIVDIARAFLDTNGARQVAEAVAESPDKDSCPFDISKKIASDATVKDLWEETLSDLNACTQKGLVEMFDSTIGAGSVFMPYGGRYQRTPVQSMAAKLPVLSGETDFATVMSYGFDPYLSSWSPYHGAVYAVLASVAKIAAAGADWRNIRFSFQEYFKKLGKDPRRWGQPLSALLGAYEAQVSLGLAAIGGKDSMSGSFSDMDVPPTLVSFAISHGSCKDMISPELKHPGNKIYVFDIPRDKAHMPDFEAAGRLYSDIYDDIRNGRIISAYAVQRHGISQALADMAFGNGLGVRVFDEVSKEAFFAPAWGSIVAEVDAGVAEKACLKSKGRCIAQVTDDGILCFADAKIPLKRAWAIGQKTLEGVFPSIAPHKNGDAQIKPYEGACPAICTHRIGTPTVFIPTLPGTNCEIDSKRAIEKAGGRALVRVMRNISAEDIKESAREFAAAIDQSQIVFLPGGFSAGDEPDGSAKFFATAFRNAKIREALEKLLNGRDGLVLGICNGFQALIKLGLVPYGRIMPQTDTSPTLTFNTIGRHISAMCYTRITSCKSPWLALADPGGVYCSPASHGEGRFVASKEQIRKLAQNGQVATQYCSPDGVVDMGPEWNMNGSYMAIEGITSPDGRVLGKMLHAERAGYGVHKNITGNQNLRLFEAGVAYFK